jgi:hypothetical protein
VVPVLGDAILWSSVRRHIISQRIITNLLKEALSFRQWDMMDESWLVGHIKEQCCFVAASAGRKGDSIHSNIEAPSKWSYAGMIELCAALPRHKNPIAQEYVLPDYSISSSKGKLGYIRGRKDGDAAKSLDHFITGDVTALHVRAGGEEVREEDGNHDSDTEGDDDDDEQDDDFNEETSDIPDQRMKAKKATVNARQVEADEETEQVLLLERERFQVPEAMFDPGLIGVYH